MQVEMLEKFPEEAAWRDSYRKGPVKAEREGSAKALKGAPPGLLTEQVKGGNGGGTEKR